MVDRYYIWVIDINDHWVKYHYCDSLYDAQLLVSRWNNSIPWRIIYRETILVASSIIRKQEPVNRIPWSKEGF